MGILLDSSLRYGSYVRTKQKFPDEFKQDTKYNDIFITKQVQQKKKTVVKPLKLKKVPYTR